MHFFKTRTRKAILLTAASLAMSLMAVKTLHARDNETQKTPNTGITTGKASWYHDKFHGRKTASGEVFSQEKMTCASNKYPLGTWLKITNMQNGKTILVKVNDRMSPRVKRMVDLSKAAAKKLGMVAAGVGNVMIENLGKKKPPVS